jgi:hypothetical protein
VHGAYLSALYFGYGDNMSKHKNEKTEAWTIKIDKPERESPKAQQSQWGNVINTMVNHPDTPREPNYKDLRRQIIDKKLQQKHSGLRRSSTEGIKGFAERYVSAYKLKKATSSPDSVADMINGGEEEKTEGKAR